MSRPLTYEEISSLRTIILFAHRLGGQTSMPIPLDRQTVERLAQGLKDLEELRREFSIDDPPSLSAEDFRELRDEQRIKESKEGSDE